ncbi:MAG: YkvA family protein [Bacteroidota bacterium]|nr:YkvA family protein [Candidatus Kapabacteria bacterium]MDW8219363.1 YkvA family protein [Bacteroidota bacterium]
MQQENTQHHAAEHDDFENKQSSLSAHQQKQLEQELLNRAQQVTREDERVVVEELPEKIASVLNSVHQRLPLVKNMVRKVKTLYAMLRDKEFHMTWSTKTMIIAGLLYFISPIDLLPDYIPLLGYIDDAFVISVVMNAIASEIERYQEYTARS